MSQQGDRGNQAELCLEDVPDVLLTVVMAPATLGLLASLKRSARGPPALAERSAVA